MKGRRRLLLAVVAVVALAGAATLTVVLVGGDDEEPQRAAPERDGASFLSKIVPPAGEDEERDTRPALRAPDVSPAVSRLADGLSLERKVAQLFLFGFAGTDLTAEIYERLRVLDIGGIVLGRQNYTDTTLLAQLGAEALVIADQEGHVPPWVLTVQDGGEFNSLPGLPPALAPADFASAGEAGAEAAETAGALLELNVTGVLGPVVDVGFESGSALGARIYSDDPEAVAAFATAVAGAYRRGGLFGAAKHFPGLGAADQSTEVGPASVGLDLAQLRERDLVPFRAAIDAGVPAVTLSHALYPMNDFVAPASLSREVATGLLRVELEFAGVAIADDLADPAITTSRSVPAAAVQALRAGADLLFISGPVADQEGAYAAVLRAARRGELPARRLNEALLRALEAKRDYGLLE
jgi:beta-N-acetylhexosaminidase